MSLIKKTCLKFRNVISFFYLNILYANECVVCKKQIFSHFPLCKNCMHKLFLKPLAKKIEMPFSYCSLCGKELISEKDICTSCHNSVMEREKNNFTTDALSLKRYFLYPYIGKYINVALYWKNENMRSLSNFFAYIIASFIKKTPKLIGLPIVPVPPRPAKLKSKGWDQMEDICIFLENDYSLNIMRILKRRDGHSQKGLLKAEREKNLIDKIYIKEKVGIPKRVILLDDVITTGSTIKICTNVLNNAKVEEVIPMLLFFN